VHAVNSAAARNSIVMSDRRATETSFVSLPGIRRRPPRGFDDDGPMSGFELLDAGAGRRLERFGEHVVDRPAPGAWSDPRAPEQWAEADLRWDRDSGWSGPGLASAREGWPVELADLAFELRPTGSGQVGLFPEHAAMAGWVEERLAARRGPSVLHLFASTGLLTLTMARAGASVAHVDAARSAVGWARRNAARNGLDDRPIRWLVDDAATCVAREVRRGRVYDGVVLDPPTYGHGTSGKAWRLESDLPVLLDDIDRLLAPDGFLLLTAHAEALDPFALGRFIGSGVEVGELELQAASGAQLRLGAFARFDRRA
jgi:23S rRNA (cytosine1962-C5)-methyltransferase